MREDTAAERVGEHEYLIALPWMRSEIPADLVDVAQFVRELGADSDRPRTSDERWGILCRVQREVGGGPLSQVTEAQVRTWWFGSGQMRLDGAGLRSPATRRAMLNHFRRFIKWTLDQDLRTDDPTRKLQKVRVPRREPRPASRAEVNEVLAGARGPARLAIQLAADLGLRCVEIAALTRDDLTRDEEGWWLWVTRKGGHRLKVAVPIKMAEKLAKTPPGTPIVPSRSGKHLTADGVTLMISRTFSRAGSQWRAHTLRHLAATEMLARTGGDIVAVADWLGHRSVATTAGYTRPTTGAIRDALDGRSAVRRRRRNSTEKDSSE